MTNTGNFNNQNGAFLNLGVSFLNSDPINYDARFIANGRFVIGDSFYNFDTIVGTSSGSIQVQDTSYNHTSGTMTGSFDFCDATPPPTSPFIDFNLGTVDPNITYCIVGINSFTADSKISIYPNPTKGVLNINFKENYNVEVYNVLGEKLITTRGNRIDLSMYQNGVYFVLLKDGIGNLIKHEKVIKQ